ncbi:hypothetical protein ISF_02132 [Cordyceps fumosorosea ARSEF 2679]|uniref:Uncharacterized protein n=1 Tax=Cordyceps fumosorosea (strain ARSEF 2679) TaxID=1081104 RepID=A0A168CN37_CORFA|nr:hypothetical protein ISF_02132 [Cordyceps fumosorosea ARSEF 2679]OAA71581.1 hypothetical protein ISF_02132 [Cordyceps fumosorosea ARSEF 2679]
MLREPAAGRNAKAASAPGGNTNPCRPTLRGFRIPEDDAGFCAACHYESNVSLQYLRQWTKSRLPGTILGMHHQALVHRGTLGLAGCREQNTVNALYGSQDDSLNMLVVIGAVGIPGRLMPALLGELRYTERQEQENDVCRRMPCAY